MVINAVRSRRRGLCNWLVLELELAFAEVLAALSGASFSFVEVSIRSLRYLFL
jgi:hypothetical protein